jgi:cystathionine beta-lyase
VTVVDQADWVVLRDSVVQLGQFASPDDCWLTLRGLRTMGVRLEQQSRSALLVAQWLQTRPEVARVLHPALPECPGHAFWMRDFRGATSLFGIVFHERYTAAAVEDMVAALAVFGLGASWGGYESLVLPTTGTISRTAKLGNTGIPAAKGPALRLHIGLEAPADLIADLEGGLAVLRAASA